jgi:hypothetical protein
MYKKNSYFFKQEKHKTSDAGYVCFVLCTLNYGMAVLGYRTTTAQLQDHCLHHAY